jgi:hypothetical protein
VIAGDGEMIKDEEDMFEVIVSRGKQFGSTTCNMTGNEMGQSLSRMNQVSASIA